MDAYFLVMDSYCSRDLLLFAVTGMCCLVTGFTVRNGWLLFSRSTTVLETVFYERGTVHEQGYVKEGMVYRIKSIIIIII